MKTLLLKNTPLLLILLTMLCLSCEKLFHENEDQYIPLDDYQDKVAFMNGVYASLVNVHDENYMYLQLRSDDICDKLGLVYLWQYNRSSGNSSSKPNHHYNHNYSNDINNIYLNLYRAILGTNDIILKSHVGTDDLILGEAYLLRAYCYFKLARYFGTPPIVVNIDVDFNLEKPTYNEVYEFIKQDLLFATDLLPEKPELARIPGETPHKGTAKALLAEVYLSMAGFPVNDRQKYTEAARLAGEVINNSQEYGYCLLDDFADLWSGKNKYNGEEILALHFQYDNVSKQNQLSETRLVVAPTRTGSPFVSLSQDIIPDYKFFIKFPHNYRKVKSMLTGTYYTDQIILPDTTIYISHFEIFKPLVYMLTYYRLALIFKNINWEIVENEITPGNYYRSIDIKSDITLYLVRYAQTLLTYAEAKARIGEIDQNALEALNKIRRRSYNLDIYAPSEYDIKAGISQQEFIDTVIAERSYELFFEPDGRWFDIIRLDLKDQLEESAYQNEDIPEDLLTEDWYFYKIPQEDRWINDKLE